MKLVRMLVATNSLHVPRRVEFSVSRITKERCFLLLIDSDRVVNEIIPRLLIEFSPTT